MMGGSSVLSSAVLKSSETSASCGGEEASLTPDNLLALRMRERLGVCEDEGEPAPSRMALELCEEELAAASIMDLDLSRVCFDWRNLGNLEEELAGVEADGV